MPPTKLRQSGKKWIKDPTTGRTTSKWQAEHFYIKTISQKELFDELNKDNTKPKVKAKIRKELTRRGTKIVKVYGSENT